MSEEMTPELLQRVRGGLDLCVHCGFCLQACPTYLALQDENDSPRGRIVLMRALLEGDVAPEDPAVQDHISRCLGCRGCESACPSGVPYGSLLEATRASLRTARPLPLLGRVVLRVFATPALLRPTMFVARILRATGIAAVLGSLPGRLGRAMRMLAATAPTRFSRSTPPDIPEGALSGGEAVLFEGCVMRELYGHVNAATEGALLANGVQMQRVAGQGCCGALHAHSGDLAGARALARANIAAFEAAPGGLVVTNAAGCGAILKEYGDLFHGDGEWEARGRAFAERVRDVSEVLAAAGPQRGAEVHMRVVYDAPCHLQHAQQVHAPPLAILGAIPGAEVVVAPDSDQCCGAAGIYNLLEPGVSEMVLSAKLRELLPLEPDVVATGNPGCMMQIATPLLRLRPSTAVAHPVELLDYSYRQHHSGGESNDRK